MQARKARGIECQVKNGDISTDSLRIHTQAPLSDDLTHISESMCVRVNRALRMLPARAPFALPLTLLFHSGLYH